MAWLFGRMMAGDGSRRGRRWGGEGGPLELPTAVYNRPQEMELGPATPSSLKIVYGCRLCRLGDFALLPTNFG